MSTRKLITISLPSPLLKKAQKLAEEENRTKSELLREALRFYVETRGVRKKAVREQLFTLIDRVQNRTKGVPSPDLKRAVQEAIQAVGSQKRLSRA